MIRIKGWEKFQHFKNRRPPWIKLYRELLDDMNWYDLSGDDAKILIQLWLIASEDKTLRGLLPENIRELSFRLRINDDNLISSIQRLEHWVEINDINLISDCLQDGTPETEIETETEFPPKNEKHYNLGMSYTKAEDPPLPVSRVGWDNGDDDCPFDEVSL